MFCNQDLRPLSVKTPSLLYARIVVANAVSSALCLASL
jgi:hypothetical protein